MPVIASGVDLFSKHYLHFQIASANRWNDKTHLALVRQVNFAFNWITIKSNWTEFKVDSGGLPLKKFLKVENS